MAITAKVRCTSKIETPGGGALLSFHPDYQDGRNSDWAQATPSLSLSMTVNEDAAEHFEQGQAYTLTFERNDS